jgi:hypothetical protein
VEKVVKSECTEVKRVEEAGTGLQCGKSKAWKEVIQLWSRGTSFDVLVFNC